MPFILILIGLMLFVTAINQTTGQFGHMLLVDTFSNGGYLYWAFAIFIIGAIGYVKSLKTISDYFLVLVILVLFLSHKGVFSQFNAALQNIANSGAANAGLNPVSLPAIGNSSTITPPLTPSINTSNLMLP
jgi:hypothetical protein